MKNIQLFSIIFIIYAFCVDNQTVKYMLVTIMSGATLVFPTGEKKVK